MNFNFTLIAILWGCLASTAFAQTPTLSPNAIDFATAGYADGPINDQADWAETRPGSFVMESGVLVARDSANAKAILQIPHSKGDTAFTVAMKFQLTLTNGSPSGNRIALATELLAEKDTAPGSERFINRLQRRRNGNNFRLQINNQAGGAPGSRATGDFAYEPFGFSGTDTISDELWFEAVYTKLNADSGWTITSRIYNLTGDSSIREFAPADTFTSSAAFHEDTTLFASISLGQSWTESQIADIRITAFDYNSVGAVVVPPPPPVDTVAPVLTLNSGTSVIQGGLISVTSNEDGTVFLVPSGTISDMDTIMSAQAAMESAIANTPVDLMTNAVDTDSAYIVYAIDSAGNISAPTASIQIVPQSISKVFANETSIYPNPVTNTLSIESESVLNRVELYTLQGQRLFIQEVSGKQAKIDLEPLNEGLYMVKVFDNDSRSFTTRISKQ